MLDQPCRGVAPIELVVSVCSSVCPSVTLRYGASHRRIDLKFGIKVDSIITKRWQSWTFLEFARILVSDTLVDFKNVLSHGTFWAFLNDPNWFSVHMIHLVLHIYIKGPNKLVTASLMLHVIIYA